MTDSSRLTEDFSYDPSSVSFDTTKNSEDLSRVSNNFEPVLLPLLDCTSDLMDTNSVGTDSKVDCPLLPTSPFSNSVLTTTETHVKYFSENYSTVNCSNSIVEQQHNPPHSPSRISNEVPV